MSPENPSLQYRMNIRMNIRMSIRMSIRMRGLFSMTVVIKLRATQALQTSMQLSTLVVLSVSNLT